MQEMRWDGGEAMQLTKPEPHTYDPGRSLPPEEFVQASREVTPITEIKTRTCKREGTNCGYRPGRWRG